MDAVKLKITDPVVILSVAQFEELQNCRKAIIDIIKSKEFIHDDVGLRFPANILNKYALYSVLD